jgi:hypothetical protein
MRISNFRICSFDWNEPCIIKVISRANFELYMYIFVSYLLFVIIKTSLNFHNIRNTEINHCNCCVTFPSKSYYVTEWIVNLDIGDKAFSAASFEAERRMHLSISMHVKAKLHFWRRKHEFHIIHTNMQARLCNIFDSK